MSGRSWRRRIRKVRDWARAKIIRNRRVKWRDAEHQRRKEAIGA